MNTPDPVKVHLFFTQHAATDAFQRAFGTATNRMIDCSALLAAGPALPNSATPDLLVRCSPDTDAQHVVSEFESARRHSELRADLASVITTLDADTTARTLLGRPHLGAPESPVTLAAHIEHASTLVLTGWDSMDPTDLNPLVALLGHLNPTATLVLLGPQAPLGPHGHATDIASVTLNRPGWIHLLGDAFSPRVAHHRVQAFRYQNFRPFHPDRLAAVLGSGFDGDSGGRVIRSAGFCRLASRPHTTILWDHCGTEIGLGRLRTEDHSPEPLTFGQDIAFFGIDLDIPRTITMLDECTLDDDEFLLGPDNWTQIPDPLPRW